MITISKSKLIRGQFCNEKGQRCMLGEVLHYFGVDDDLLRDNTYSALQRALAEEPKRILFTLSNCGHWIMSRTAQEITELNDEEEYEAAAKVLNEAGIEVKLVD